MNKLLYTPGPWNVYCSKSNSNRYSIVKYYEPELGEKSEQKMVGIFIAEIETDNPRHRRLAFDVPANSRFNAVLISRAPDLYNALLEADQILKDAGINIEFGVLNELQNVNGSTDI
jgi:hypothetical protein